ncbi:MAG: ATP--guanido phosphotransferase [Clostridia bacterium]|nr:ATP--guanido phosphotransferase [Clostridia bacterium]
MSVSTVLSSRVRLARNYSDLPFDLSERPDLAEDCLSRTAGALATSGADKGFLLHRMADLSEGRRAFLAESRLISGDLARAVQTGAVLLNERDGLSVMIGEEDHLRIQAIRPRMELAEAAGDCFRLEDALSKQVSFAFDPELGYLTACPTNTGTGLRASILVHLPMVSQQGKSGEVSEMAARLGLTIRGVFGKGRLALGDVYMVSNHVTLGRTEEELISAVLAVGRHLTDLEATLRETSRREERLTLENRVYRAWALLRSARTLSSNEFYNLWSSARLGLSLGWIEAEADTLDALLWDTLPQHLVAWRETALDEKKLNEARAECVLNALGKLF